VPGLEHFVLCCAPEKKARRSLFQPSRGMSVPDLLCFTKSDTAGEFVTRRQVRA